MEMDWKQRRTVSVLSAILALLSAAVLIVLGIRYRASRPAEAAEPAWTGEPEVQEDRSALHYYNGSATLSFTLDGGGNWIWADEPDFPLDPANITAIMDLVENLQYQQVLTPEDELSAYGLDVPSATLTAAGADGEARTLALGGTTTDGSSRYMMENDDSSTLYIIADTLYGYLKTPIYDMMRLPEIPVFTEDRLRGLSIQGAAPAAAEGEEEPRAAPVTALTARWSELGRTASWSQGGENVTDSAALQSLIAHLRTLSLRKCVDYRPSAEAASICGFDTPPAALAVDYVTETGEAASWSLTLGGPAADGRYVRLGEESHIYLIAREFADALLEIAVNGL